VCANPKYISLYPWLFIGRQEVLLQMVGEKEEEVENLQVRSASCCMVLYSFHWGGNKGGRETCDIVLLLSDCSVVFLIVSFPQAEMCDVKEIFQQQVSQLLNQMDSGH
jgi:hypothetical protein